MLELAHEYVGEVLDFMKKYRKLQKKGFWSTDLLRKGHEVHTVGHIVHRGKINVVQPKDLWVSKDTDFYVDLKNINLP
jgi:hypothetical protein